MKNLYIIQCEVEVNERTAVTTYTGVHADEESALRQMHIDIRNNGWTPVGSRINVILCPETYIAIAGESDLGIFSGIFVLPSKFGLWCNEHGYQFCVTAKDKNDAKRAALEQHRMSPDTKAKFIVFQRVPNSDIQHALAEIKRRNGQEQHD